MMQHVFPTYNRFPFEIVSGNGFKLTDNKGMTYLDFTSGIGVCGLGYNVSKLNEAVEKQLGKVWHTSNLYESSLQESVAKKLGEAHGVIASFCNSGTEANEAAFKLARKATGKSEVLAFDHSFHGRTYGSLSLTGNDGIKEGFGPLVPGVSFAKYNDFAALDEINDQKAAVILEVVQGEGGVVVGDASWLKAVEEKAHEAGALLIIDEVQTGMGRTGKLFAFENFELNPDIVTVAKGLANGIPVGAMLGKKELAKFFGPGTHGSTFAGNPLAMAAADVVLDELNAEFLKGVSEKADFIKFLLEQKAKNIDAIESISGLGLMIGIHLKETVDVGKVVSLLQDKGLLTLSARGNTLRLLPPLITPASELMTGIEIITETLENILVA